MSNDDRPNVIAWPPILYVTVLLASYGLHRLWPLQPIVGEPIASFLGWPLCLSGLCIGVAAILRFRRLGTPIDPTSRATTLATGGIYRWTRNPCTSVS